ncbi:hypothetical protein SNE40_007609 [Patella caerulea]|uniref:Uncharacterized protein n=2 Tax=Patella caerulea TaxID=87958 RepID=A0AAN8K3X3_PATCE
MRGDYSFIPKKIRCMSKSMILSRSLMYSGSQVAYMLWGYYFTIVVLFFYFMIVSYLIILPFAGRVSYEFLFIFWALVPTIIVSYSLFYTQKFLANKVFLQKGLSFDSNHRMHRPLALDNRRLYHIVSYFLFFFYIFVGLCKAIIRVVKGVVLGVAYLSRLDRCNLIPGFEHWDPGYLSYVSILQVEMAHCHPVLVTFCHLLKQNPIPRRSSFFIEPNIEDTEAVMDSPIGRRRLVINRWLKLYTLARNPTLIPIKKCDS